MIKTIKPLEHFPEHEQEEFVRLCNELKRNSQDFKVWSEELPAQLAVPAQRDVFVQDERENEPYKFSGLNKDWVGALKMELLLKFDKEFHSHNDFGCLIWATGPESTRVRFDIGSSILTGPLKGQKSIDTHRNLQLCNDNREFIEGACRRAFEGRPSSRIELQESDFR